MSDTLVRFRNVERSDIWDESGIRSEPVVLASEFTALLAFAEEQQQKLDAIPIIVKDRDDYRRKVEEQQKEIERLTDERNTWMEIASSRLKLAAELEAKLAAMEEVVEAGRKLAKGRIDRYSIYRRCNYCLESWPTDTEPIHFDGCPVGIVLSFTKKEGK